MSRMPPSLATLWPHLPDEQRSAIRESVALLLVCVITFVVTEAVCLLLGQLCQLIDGADE
jgi:hypothetical protein